MRGDRTETVIACALIPRFALLATLGERRALLSKPLALAPEPGGPQVVGEVSGPAEAFGIGAGMRLGEALARCPELGLVTPDPERAESAWEAALRRLEGIGARVEPACPGEAFFAAGGLVGLYGSLERVLGRGRDAVGPGARMGGGSSRLCAYAAALRTRRRRAPTIVPAAMTRSFLAPLPVGLLGDRLSDGLSLSGGAADAARTGFADLPEKLRRLGLESLGQLAALPDAAVADRFGETGLR
ncbi:MAG: hypothetical protein ACRDK1_10545, partial [Solirubrobacterales bacterium]